MNEVVNITKSVSNFQNLHLSVAHMATNQRPHLLLALTNPAC